MPTGCFPVRKQYSNSHTIGYLPDISIPFFTYRKQDFHPHSTGCLLDVLHWEGSQPVELCRLILVNAEGGARLLYCVRCPLDFWKPFSLASMCFVCWMQVKNVHKWGRGIFIKERPEDLGIITVITDRSDSTDEGTKWTVEFVSCLKLISTLVWIFIFSRQYDAQIQCSGFVWPIFQISLCLIPFTYRVSFISWQILPYKLKQLWMGHPELSFIIKFLSPFTFPNVHGTCGRCQSIL